MNTFYNSGPKQLDLFFSLITDNELETYLIRVREKKDGCIKILEFENAARLRDIERCLHDLIDQRNYHYVQH